MFGLVSRIAVTCVASLLILVFATNSSAQLQDAVWDEYLKLFAGDFSEEVFGENLTAPDRLSQQWLGDGYYCDASVSFPRSGAPYAEVRVDLDLSNPALDPSATANFRLEAWFHLRQLAEPPFVIVFVPLTIQRARHAEILNGFPPQTVPMGVAVATEFHVSGDMGSMVISDEIAVNNMGGLQSDHFAKTTQVQMRPEEIGSIYAFTTISVGGASSAGRVEAMGWLDPVIEVSDQLIPGTSINYRDVYRIELSKGFWALPAQQTSWGSLKQKFKQ